MNAHSLKLPLTFWEAILRDEQETASRIIIGTIHEVTPQAAKWNENDSFAGRTFPYFEVAALTWDDESVSGSLALTPLDSTCPVRVSYERSQRVIAPRPSNHNASEESSQGSLSVKKSILPLTCAGGKMPRRASGHLSVFTGPANGVTGVRLARRLRGELRGLAQKRFMVILKG